MHKIRFSHVEEDRLPLKDLLSSANLVATPQIFNIKSMFKDSISRRYFAFNPKTKHNL